MKQSLPWLCAALVLVFAVAAWADTMTALHRAAMSGDVETVKSYVKRRRNLDPRYDEPTRGLEGNYARVLGITPLMLAARYGQLEAAKLLVEGGADIYAKANTQLPGVPLTAFDFAVQSGQIAVADYLWKKGDASRSTARLVEHISNTCIQSCKEGFPTDVASNIALYLISIAPDEAAGNGVGSAVCSSLKPLETLEFIEKHAARPPRNTLHCMAYGTYSRHRPWEQRKAVLTWMLDHGADVNGLMYGWTPLMGAAAAQDLDTAKLLVERGADPNMSGNYLPAVAAAANTCGPAADAQLAMVAYLAPLSDRGVYTNPEIFKKGYLIKQCCARQPQAASQRRICEVFGL